MKVTLSGFALSYPPSELTTPEDFHGYLLAPAGNTFLEQNTLAMCQVQHGGRLWFAGVLVHDRQTRLMTVKEKLPGKFVVKPHELQKNETATDFNFFVYDPATQRGLYQFYHHSVTLRQFLGLLDMLYRMHKNSAFEALQEEDPLPDESTLKLLRKDARERLAGVPIVRTEQLAELIQELARISRVDLEFVSFEPSQPGQWSELTALSEQARRRVHHMIFSKEVGPMARLRAVAMFKNTELVNQNLKTAKVKGFTSDGLEQIYALASNPDRFGQDDYESWVQEIALDSSQWEASLKEAAVIKRLLNITDQPRVHAVLTTPVE